MWLLMVTMLPAAWQPLISLHPLLVVVMSPQVVQVPVIAMLLMASAPALEVVTIAPVPSSYLLTVHDNDDDITPLLSLQNAVPRGCGESKDCDGVDHVFTYACLYDDAQSDDDDDESADILEAILGHLGQRDDTGYDDDGVDVSVGVDVGAVVGVGVHGQGVNLGVGLGVCLVVGPPPPTSLDS